MGCAHEEYFPGTTIVRSEQNRKIIETVEQYRRRGRAETGIKVGWRNGI